MLFAPIVPIPMLHLLKNDKYHMALAGMFKHKDYFDFYVDVDGHLILDNGVAEQELTSAEDLLRLAYSIGADEVIAPDVYGDMERTLMSLKTFMPVAQHYNVMAVLHAETWMEFEKILKESVRLGVDALALPRVMAESLGSHARLEAAEIVRKETDLPIHALGSTKVLREGIDLARQGIVRGIDSSAPVVLGLKGWDLSEPYSAGRRPADFWSRNPTEQAIINLNSYRVQIGLNSV